MAKFKHIFVLLASVLLSLSATAGKNISLGSGAWDAAGTWSKGVIPGPNDTIRIQSGHVVSITSNITITGGPVSIIVDGELNFHNAGSKLTLDCGSGVDINPGGILTTTGTGGGSSQVLKICGLTLWTRQDGDQPGPVSFGTSLPVELVSLEAVERDDDVLVSWITASEIDNNYFAIERSFDGVTFEHIGSVQGQGTTSALTSYQFSDRVMTNGIRYYRLKQVDFSGVFEYSDVIALNLSVSGVDVTVYPNPVEGQQVSLTLTGLGEGEVVALTLHDASGRTVYEQSISINTDATQRELIDLQGRLAPGTYQLVGYAGDNRFDQVLVVR